MPTIHKIKTWKCSNDKCTYSQDFDPTNLEQMKLHFPNVPVGNCPACYQGQSRATTKCVKCSMVAETNEVKKINVTIMTDEEIDNLPAKQFTKYTPSKKELKEQAKKARLT